ncbi:hypothetical protein NQD34_014548 [Periophthalmus magnuspinnatus]|nr:hypothetical protein NQD34_014548 [Periophthalmus magnuspinnatus]
MINWAGSAGSLRANKNCSEGRIWSPGHSLDTPGGEIRFRSRIIGCGACGRLHRLHPDRSKFGRKRALSNNARSCQSNLLLTLAGSNLGKRRYLIGLLLLFLP